MGKVSTFAARSATSSSATNPTLVVPVEDWNSSFPLIVGAVVKKLPVFGPSEQG